MMDIVLNLLHSGPESSKNSVNTNYSFYSSCTFLVSVGTSNPAIQGLVII